MTFCKIVISISRAQSQHPKKLRHFDEEYTLYLDAQRRDSVAAALAERKRQRAQADFQSDQYSTRSISPLAPPMVITPTNVRGSWQFSSTLKRLTVPRCILNMRLG